MAIGDLTRGRLGQWAEPVLIGVLLALATWAAHGGALKGEFHYDDVFAIVHNPAVQVWDPIRYFTSASAVISEANGLGYRPLTVASLAFNYRVAGADPFAYLLVNLLLHLVISGLIYVVGRELLGDVRWAALAALLWTIHPLNAEAVNYAAARSSLLVALFSLVACWAYLRRVEQGAGAGWAVFGVAAFVAALLSKESAAALVIPLLAYGPLRARVGWRGGERAIRWQRGVWEALPYVVVAVVYVVAWRSLIGARLVPPGPATMPGWVFAELLARSLALWVWPWPLGLDHPLTALFRVDAALATRLLTAGALLAAVIGYSAVRAPRAAWCWSWILAGLAPLAPLPWLTTIGLLQEHRMGFSAVGLAWLSAAAVRWLSIRFDVIRHPSRRRIFAVIGMVLVVSAIAVDRARSAVWNDDRLLWQETVRRNPDHLLARINLGSAYMARGEFDRAEAVYRELVAMAPNYPRVYYNLGLLALRRAEAGNRDAAADDVAAAAFRRAVALDPRDANAYAHLGVIALRRGEAPFAEDAFQRALGVDPTHRDALNNLGTLYLERREWEKALEVFTRALTKEPLFLEAAYNRAVALSALRRDDEAREALLAVRARLPEETRFDPYRQGIDHLLAGGRL